MPRIFFLEHRYVIRFVTLAMVTMASPVDAGVQVPPCDAAERWALSIDPKDRWYPNPAQKKLWLPARFQGADFESLFGAPATQWTLDDVKTARPALQACMTAARKAKRKAEHKALNTARVFITGNLKAYIVQTARAQDKLDKNLDAFLSLPDSAGLLQTLAVLRELQAGDRSALRDAQKRIAQIGGAEAKAARQIITAAYSQTAQAYEQDTLPRLNERYDTLRNETVRLVEEQLGAHSTSAQGLTEIDAVLARAREDYGRGLGAQDYAALEQVAGEERAGLRSGILDAARARLDGLAVAAASIAEAQTVFADTAPSLDTDSTERLRTAVSERQRAIAEELLSRAERAIRGFPPTLAGIDELGQHVDASTRIVAGHVAQERVTRFVDAASTHRSTLAATALPEFETSLSKLPADAAGLQALDAQAQRVESWQGIAPATRSAYEELASARRNEIAIAIAEAGKAREQQRQRAVVEAVKARMDALPADFGTLATIDAEVKAAHARGLDAAAAAEVKNHASARRTAVADEMLSLAAPKLKEGPRSVEGLGQLIDIVDAVIAETKDAASASSLDAFQSDATGVVTALGREVLKDFAGELAALTMDRGGLEQAQGGVVWAEGLHYMPQGLRGDYVRAAYERRDEIARALAAAETQRRERVLAAGGDPELVGYTFDGEDGIASLEFVSEKRAIFSAIGMRFGATYEVIGNDIFLDGPNGSIVFAREGNSLSGMGLNLKRAER